MEKKIVVVTIVDGTDEDILHFKQSFILGFTLKRIVGEKYFLVFQAG